MKRLKKEEAKLDYKKKNNPKEENLERRADSFEKEKEN